MAIRVISFSGHVAQNLVSSAASVRVANSHSVQQRRILSRRFFVATQKSDLNQSGGVQNFYSDHRRPKSNSCIKNSAYATLAGELVGESCKNPIISSIIPFFQGSKWLRVLTEKVSFFKAPSWLQEFGFKSSDDVVEVQGGKLFSLAYEMSSMVMFTLFRKQFRGRMKGTTYQDNQICFGKYALQALEPAWITSRQIEAGRRAISRNVHRGGQIWVRIFPDKPVTAKPIETRMGKGKGSPEYLVAVVKPGKILYEVGGVSETIARKAISLAASKMPIRTQFILSEERGPLV